MTPLIWSCTGYTSETLQSERDQKGWMTLAPELWLMSGSMECAISPVAWSKDVTKRIRPWELIISYNQSIDVDSPYLSSSLIHHLVISEKAQGLLNSMHFFSPALWPFLPILAGTNNDQQWTSETIWVFPTKNRGILPPKWMVKIMEHLMNKWMIWGYCSPIFGSTPICVRKHGPPPSISFNFLTGKFSAPALAARKSLWCQQGVCCYPCTLSASENHKGPQPPHNFKSSHWLLRCLSYLQHQHLFPCFSKACRRKPG